MGFFDKLKPEPRAIVVDHSIGMTRVKGNVQANGHQPSTVDCPKCLAHPGQGCGGLRHGYYHGPRLTAYTRQELRERKADRKTQAATRQADVDRLVASAELRDRTADAIARATARSTATLEEWARRVAHSELTLFSDTVTNEVVAEYGWTTADVLRLKTFTTDGGGNGLKVILAAQGECIPIDEPMWETFSPILRAAVDARRAELEAVD